MTLLCYEFEKHVMIAFAVVAAVLTIGLFISLVGGEVYGQVDKCPSGYELNEFGSCHTLIPTGVLFEYKGYFYCYDASINTEDTVKLVVDKDLFYEPLKIKNDLIANIAEDGNIELAKKICQNMVEDGSIGGW